MEAEPPPTLTRLRILCDMANGKVMQLRQIGGRSKSSSAKTHGITLPGWPNATAKIESGRSDAGEDTTRCRLS